MMNSSYFFEASVVVIDNGPFHDSYYVDGQIHIAIIKLKWLLTAWLIAYVNGTSKNTFYYHSLVCTSYEQ